MYLGCASPTVFKGAKCKPVSQSETLHLLCVVKLHHTQEGRSLFLLPFKKNEKKSLDTRRHGAQALSVAIKISHLLKVKKSRCL